MASNELLLPNPGGGGLKNAFTLHIPQRSQNHWCCLSSPVLTLTKTKTKKRCSEANCLTVPHCLPHHLDKKTNKQTVLLHITMLSGVPTYSDRWTDFPHFGSMPVTACSYNTANLHGLPWYYVKLSNWKHTWPQKFGYAYVLDWWMKDEDLHQYTLPSLAN